jgi:hypothetical protein
MNFTLLLRGKQTLSGTRIQGSRLTRGMGKYKHIWNPKCLRIHIKLPLILYDCMLLDLWQGTSEDVLTTDKVRYWSDFNRVYYHPRSAIQVNQYQLNTSSFDSYDQGRDLFLDIGKVPILVNRAHGRGKTFWTGMSGHSQRKAIPCRAFKSSWKVILHGQVLVQNT